MKLALFSLCNLSLFILLFSSISLSGQINSEHYKIYSVKLNKEVSLQDIAEDMTNADVLFFGEEHNDSVTHYLEAKMLEALYQKFKNQLVLSMEMFDRDVQNVVNEYLKDQIRERNFVKDARTWSNYRDYRPMVEFAKTNQLDIICANAPTRYTNLAGRKGQGELKKLTKDAKNHFAPLPYKMASGGYLAKLNALTSHTPPASSDTTAAKKMPGP